MRESIQQKSKNKGSVLKNIFKNEDNIKIEKRLSQSVIIEQNKIESYGSKTD